MFKLFSSSSKSSITSQAQGDSFATSGFDYLSEGDYYFDSACQTLRPTPVIQAMEEYFKEFNSCGHRVTYPWGEKLDKKSDKTREDILKFVGKKSKDYTVAFTLNTTYGINLILSQLDYSAYQNIVTSDIEHNSVFLPTIVHARKNSITRTVLERNNDGYLNYQKNDVTRSVVLVNTTSNIDGRSLTNIDTLTKDVHAEGGIILLDACQTLGHNPQLIRDVEFDVLFGSGHKMYGPSIGFIVIKKSLLTQMNIDFIGGGTVENVTLDSYSLISDPNEQYSVLEPGLQSYSGIVGLGAAIEWRQEFSHEGMSAREYEDYLAQHLFDRLSKVKNITIINEDHTNAISMIPKTMSGHQLGMYLGQAGFMVRTGYHCCHYYLKEKKKLDPTLRISLGLNNTIGQIDSLINQIDSILN